MARTDTVRARIEPEVKVKAEAIFETLGLNSSEAINLFYRQVLLRNGLPFNVIIPNDTTKAAMQDAIDNHNLDTFNTIEELKKDLE